MIRFIIIRYWSSQLNSNRVVHYKFSIFVFDWGHCCYRDVLPLFNSWQMLLDVSLTNWRRPSEIFKVDAHISWRWTQPSRTLMLFWYNDVQIIRLTEMPRDASWRQVRLAGSRFTELRLSYYVVRPVSGAHAPLKGRNILIGKKWKSTWSKTT